MDMKFGMDKFFDARMPKMMVPIRENEIFNVILAFKQREQRN